MSADCDAHYGGLVGLANQLQWPQLRKKATIPAPMTADCRGAPDAHASDSAAEVRHESASATLGADRRVTSADAEDQPSKKAATAASLIRRQLSSNTTNEGILPRD